MVDNNNTKWRRVEKGRGREGATGVQGAPFFYILFQYLTPQQLLPAAQPPHFPLLDHSDPTKMTNVMRRDFPPPHRVSFCFECDEEGLPFVLNMTGRGKPLLVTFPFILTTSGREDTRENAKGLGV